MSQTITIYRRETANTSPRGFGYAPTYHIDEPYHDDTEMIWIEPIEITIPDGYTVRVANNGGRYLYDTKNEFTPIEDDHGHPAINMGVWQNKAGKPFVRYQRLDK